MSKTQPNAASQAAIKRLSHYQEKCGILGLAELAKILGYTKNRTAMKIKRGKLPKPDFELAATSCWRADKINKWLEHNPL